MSNNELYVIDVKWPRKALGLAYSGASGTLAAASVVQIGKIAIHLLALPEIPTAIISLWAFAHFANDGLTYWNDRVRPQDLVVRKVKEPTLKL